MVKTTLSIACSTALAALAHRSARRFGRRAPCVLRAAHCREPAVSEDLRLFAMTFAAGFLFMIVFSPDRLSRLIAGEVELPAEPGGDDAADGDDQQAVGDGHAELDRDRQDQRRRDHQARIDDVVGGDRPRGFGLGHGGGEEGVERHDEHAAGDRHAEQVEGRSASRREWRGRLPGRAARPGCAGQPSRGG